MKITVEKLNNNNNNILLCMVHNWADDLIKSVLSLLILDVFIILSIVMNIV